MEKFEVGKIYQYKDGRGCGYDECISYDYYLITRKTEKSIWWKKISVAVEVYGKAVDEKADFKKFEKAVEKRSKLSEYDGGECFSYKRESGCQEYIFFKYTKEVK